MKLTLRDAVAAIILLLSFASPAAAGPLEDANAAYRRDDYATVVRLVRPLAEQGNAEAQLLLGVIYDGGSGGVPKDYAEAARLYRKAAEQGNANAMQHLMFIYSEGHGVPKDDAEAARWNRKFGQIKSSEARKAAEQGDTEAQVSLGQMYEDGYGVSKDIPEAIRRYRLANRAMPEGLHCLGSCMKTASMYRGIMSKHTCGSTSPQPKGTNLPPKAGTASNM